MTQHIKFFSIFIILGFFSCFFHFQKISATNSIKNQFLIYKINQKNFRDIKEKIIQKLALVENKEEKYILYLSLLEHLFQNSLYQETLDMYEFIVNNYVDITNLDKKTIFFVAVSLTLTGKYFDAKKEFEKIEKEESNFLDEILMWKNYNLSLQDNIKTNISYFLKLQNEILQDYPEKIYKMLQESFLKQLFNTGQFQKILSMNKLDDIASDFYTSIAEYKLGKDLEILKKKLSKLSLQDSLQWSTKAKMKLIEINLENNQISLQDAIDLLNNLNYQLLDTNMRFYLLDMLAIYYRKNDELAKSLSIYQYLNNNFEHLSHEISLYKNSSEDAIKILSKQDMSNWNKLSFFNRFSEMLPLGDIGNVIISEITDSLINLNLLDDAIELLEHQIKFKLKGRFKFLNELKLSKIYSKQKRFKDAINLLNNIEIPSQEFKNHQKILLLKARNFFSLQNYDRAISILEGIDSNKAIKLKKDIYFFDKKYESFINLMENHKSKNPDIDAQDQIKLAIAYFNLEKQDKLDALYQDIINNSTLKTKFLELFSTYLSIQNSETKDTVKLQNLLNQISQEIKIELK
ncbi:MAG: hypothetical protein ISN64_03935 [Rickettsia sp.]|nr:hypothetical protein [Rickettsia sp.]